jgi:hypothetical protein
MTGPVMGLISPAMVQAPGVNLLVPCEASCDPPAKHYLSCRTLTGVPVSHMTNSYRRLICTMLWNGS